MFSSRSAYAVHRHHIQATGSCPSVGGLLLMAPVVLLVSVN
jgi:hypothetical protein